MGSEPEKVGLELLGLKCWAGGIYFHSGVCQQFGWKYNIHVALKMRIN